MAHITTVDRKYGSNNRSSSDSGNGGESQFSPTTDQPTHTYKALITRIFNLI
jgi:hypothetical protein